MSVNVYCNIQRRSKQCIIFGGTCLKGRNALFSLHLVDDTLHLHIVKHCLHVWAEVGWEGGAVVAGIVLPYSARGAAVNIL